MNFRPIGNANGSTVYGYQRIGGWDSGELSLGDDVFWPGNDRGYTYKSGSIKSVCSDPCPPGEIKVGVFGKLGQKKGVKCEHVIIVMSHSCLIYN